MRHSRTRLIELAILFALGAAISRAYGQASPQAEALFRDGRQLIKAGKVAEACAAFEGSERAEHNVSTVMNLADCREKNQQYAAAWALFLQADSQTRSDATKQTVNGTAKRRAKALEARLSYLIINVPDESRIPDLIVTRDGAPVDPAEWNRAIPADGGSHVIAGKAPGHESWQTTITLRPESDKQSVEVPRFKALPVILHREAPRTVERAAAAPEPPLWTTRRKVALGVAGGGAAVGIAAIVLGAGAQSLRNDAVATCPPSACSPDDARAAADKNDRARSRAMLANVGFGVAGAAIVTGAVLWLTGRPSASTVAVAPLPSFNGIALSRSF